MKKLFAFLCLSLMLTVSAKAQNGFAYQATIRDGENLICNQTVGLRFTLSCKGEDYYSESHLAISNAYGNVSVIVGEGTVLSGSYESVPWSSMSVMMKIEVDAKGGTDYSELGSIQIQPVPYAMYAKSAGHAEISDKSAKSDYATNSDKSASSDHATSADFSKKPTTEIMAEADASDDEILFSVKDKAGNLVFAVYQDGVEIYINDADSAKAAGRGFAVAGREATKAGNNNYFVINNNGTRVFVDTDSAKAAGRGFAVAGREATKAGETNNILTVDNAGTKVYVDDAAVKAAGRGFAVAGREATKAGENNNYFTVDNLGTKVFVDTDSAKAAGRGFAVAGREATKAGETNNILTVDNAGTKVYVDDAAAKAAGRGFAVAGREATKDGESNNYFTVDNAGTKVYVDDAAGKAAGRGFAVAGREATKDGENNNILTVDNAGTKVYVDDAAGKAAGRGFAVAGREATKDGENNNILIVDNAGTKVYVDDAAGKAAGRGFAVAGREATKDGENNNYFTVDNAGTKVYVDDAAGKAAGRGFAVAGREATKADVNSSYFSVNNLGTKVTVDGTGSASQRTFEIEGLDEGKSKGISTYASIGGNGSTFYVDKSSGRGLYVNSREGSDRYLSVYQGKVNIKTDLNVYPKSSNDATLSVANGMVKLNGDMLVGGEMGSLEGPGKGDVKYYRDFYVVYEYNDDKIGGYYFDVDEAMKVFKSNTKGYPDDTVIELKNYALVGVLSDGTCFSGMNDGIHRSVRLCFNADGSPCINENDDAPFVLDLDIEDRRVQNGNTIDEVEVGSLSLQCECPVLEKDVVLDFVLLYSEAPVEKGATEEGNVYVKCSITLKSAGKITYKQLSDDEKAYNNFDYYYAGGCDYTSYGDTCVHYFADSETGGFYRHVISYNGTSSLQDCYYYQRGSSIFGNVNNALLYVYGDPNYINMTDNVLSDGSVEYAYTFYRTDTSKYCKGIVVVKNGFVESITETGTEDGEHKDGKVILKIDKEFQNEKVKTYDEFIKDLQKSEEYSFQSGE